MSDLIDRQAMIDAMAELQGRASTKAEFKGISKAWKRIKKLPSAEPEQPERCSDCEWWTNQPEIIRCRNCKFASGDSRICMQFGHSPIGELDFCAWAERRTDG